VIMGQPGKVVFSQNVTGNKFLSADEIRRTLQIPDTFNVKRIAHAGGGIDGDTYTNSLEAANYNYDLGFRYFELDFTVTSDNRLVCLHDWEGSFERSFDLPPRGRVTYDEFLRLADEHARYSIFTLDRLAQWMDEHPDAVIVTDIKEQNPEMLKVIAETLPNFSSRVIPQIYQPENFARVKALGFSQVIWTLYLYRGSNESVLEWVSRFEEPCAVTMPPARAKTDLPQRLSELNVPTYVHTINTEEAATYYLVEQGVTEIYTDVLAPE